MLLATIGTNRVNVKCTFPDFFFYNEEEMNTKPKKLRENPMPCEPDKRDDSYATRKSYKQVRRRD